MARKRTIKNAGGAWDHFVEKELRDEESQRLYLQSRAKIKAASDLAATLDEAREIRETTKAEVARRMETHAPAISRLFGGEGINPQLSTIYEAAVALGLHIKLEVEFSNNGHVPLEVISKLDPAAAGQLDPTPAH